MKEANLNRFCMISTYVIFWKRQMYGDREKVSNWGGGGKNRQNKRILLVALFFKFSWFLASVMVGCLVWTSSCISNLPYNLFLFPFLLYGRVPPYLQPFNWIFLFCPLISKSPLLFSVNFKSISCSCFMNIISPFDSFNL